MKGDALIMKLNEEQNKALEELYRIARGYVNLAKAINDVADETRNLSADDSSDGWYMKTYVTAQTAYIKDLVKACDVDTKSLECKLNSMNEAFKKD